MLIINADDWGRSRAETDNALTCHDEGRITSASAMVYMEDSERAAELAKSDHIGHRIALKFHRAVCGEKYPSEPARYPASCRGVFEAKQVRKVGLQSNVAASFSLPVSGPSLGVPSSLWHPTFSRGWTPPYASLLQHAAR
jgi:YdjC-like protein